MLLFSYNSEGGVILGKATCEDLCYSANSHTSAKGPVSNPLNKQHCAGGSSSGCAVLVCNTKEEEGGRRKGTYENVALSTQSDLRA